MTEDFCLSQMIAQAKEFRKDKDVISAYVVKQSIQEFLKELKSPMKEGNKGGLCICLKRGTKDVWKCGHCHIIDNLAKSKFGEKLI